MARLTEFHRQHPTTITGTPGPSLARRRLDAAAPFVVIVVPRPPLQPAVLTRTTQHASRERPNILFFSGDTRHPLQHLHSIAKSHLLA
jgi:hypothetical protein